MFAVVERTEKSRISSVLHDFKGLPDEPRIFFKDFFGHVEKLGFFHLQLPNLMDVVWPACPPQ